MMNYLFTFLAAISRINTPRLCLGVLVWLGLQTVSLAQNTESFTYTGANQTFTVPPGVTSLHVVAKGAKGNGVRGGNGGIVEADMQVTPGQVLTIVVGGAGGFFTGGFNGGGAEDWTGGGATDIRVGGSRLEDRKIVAGGGGGGQNSRGGNGGGLVGQAGEAFIAQTPGGGGTQTAGGAGGIGTISGVTGARRSYNGDAGTLGIGGNGEDAGGGGGYYGGGGGGMVLSLIDGSGIRETAGGGGGSSYTDPTLCSSVSHTQGGNTERDGSLIITYELPSFLLATEVTPTTVCAGGSVALSVSATEGTAPYSYTWIAPPGSSITGSGSAVTGSVSTTASGVQTFTVTVADSDNPPLIATQTVSVTVVGIDITTQPAASSLVCVDGSVSVPVSVSGAIDSYLWHRNDVPVQG